jgi:hypothetical protein
MPEHRPDPRPIVPAQQAIGRAIQDLVVARLARGFIPLAILFAFGAVESSRRAGYGEATLVAVGAVVTSAAMLAYGLRIVQHAFGRRLRAWMYVASVGGVAPPLYALYLIGWRGLRLLGFGNGLAGIGTAILFVAMGVWLLRCWMNVVEVERLARIMPLNQEEHGGSA